MVEQAYAVIDGCTHAELDPASPVSRVRLTINYRQTQAHFDMPVGSPLVPGEPLPDVTARAIYELIEVLVEVVASPPRIYSSARKRE